MLETRTYMFDMDPSGEEDFMLSLPVAQNIAFSISIYSNEDGVYIKSANLDG
jgi:hypothetical protein